MFEKIKTYNTLSTRAEAKAGFELQFPVESIRRYPTFPESGGEHSDGSDGHGRMDSPGTMTTRTQKRKSNGRGGEVVKGQQCPT